MNAIISRIHNLIKVSVTENRGIKVLALLISLGLFVAVRTQEKIDRWVEVPVDAVLPMDSSGLALTSKPIDVIRVYVRGRPSAVERLRMDENRVVRMDLSGKTRPGSFTYFFDEEKFSLRDVEILEVRPDGVPIRLEKILSKTLPVHVKTVGALNENLIFSRPPKMVPDRVTIRGAASIVQSLTAIETDDVYISDLKKGVTDFPVQLALAEGVEFRRDGFTAKFFVTPVFVQRTFTDVSLPMPESSNKGLVLIPDRVDVVLSGPVDALDRLAETTLPVQLHKSQNIKRIPGRAAQFSVHLAGLPSDVQVVSVEPPTVGLTVGSPD